MEHTNATLNTQWKTFYKMAAVMALLIVLAGLVDTITSIMGGEAQENSVIPVTEWFSLFHNSRFYAFSYLGAINMITLSLGIPVYLALCHAHWRIQPAFALLAAVLFCIGVAIYISSNTVLSMFALSSQYFAAPAAQKPELEAAGRALLALGADLTPGTFMGFFFTQSAGLLITAVMFQARVFSKWAAGFGLAGYFMTSIFFVLSAFVPASFDTAMGLAMAGGPLLLVYQILLARRFFQLAN